jgi:phage-related baseplate assembly protein
MSDSTSILDLPVPIFVNDTEGLDPLAVQAAMVSAFQAAANRTLYPAQLEQLLINLYAYRETLVRNAIQAAALQNLLAFATYPIIDYLGQLVGCYRLNAQPATCVLQFTLANVLTVSYTIPVSTQVGTADGAMVFSPLTPLIIPAGATVGTVPGVATTPGAAGNGYLAGQVNVLLGGNALIGNVINTTTTSGGGDSETDAHFRNRIQAAPNQYTTTGPSGAYRYFALSADPTIVDASIPPTPTPGTVYIYVLIGPIVTQPASSPNTAAIASPAVIAEVQNACSALTVRPLCDTVVVAAVSEVDYTVTATIMIYNNIAQTLVQPLVVEAAAILMSNLCNTVQQDIVPSQWVAALSVYGVYGVDITLTATIVGSGPMTPTADGRYVLTAGQWANCTSITYNYVTVPELLV